MLDLTVCLLNWKRPENISRIISALHGRVRLFLWDNSGLYPKDNRLDWQVTSSVNKNCSPRWWMAQMAETKYVCSLDDDLIPADEAVLSDAVNFFNSVRSPIAGIGPYGKKLDPKTTYYSNYVANTQQDEFVDLLLGRFIMIEKERLKNLNIRHPEDDIELCAALSQKQKKQFLVPHIFRNRFIDLPSANAISERPGHYERRTQAVEQLWGFKFLPHPRTDLR